MNLHNDIMNIPVNIILDGPEGVGNVSQNRYTAYKEGHRDARHAAAELSLKTEARIEELEEQLKESEKLVWEHFYIHQEVFNYLLSKGYVDSVVEGDNWEAAAQNIINAIKNVENER